MRRLKNREHTADVYHGSRCVRYRTRCRRRGATVSYIDENGSSQRHEATALSSGSAALSEGWYCVSSNRYDHRHI